MRKLKNVMAIFAATILVLASAGSLGNAIAETKGATTETITLVSPSKGETFTIDNPDVTDFFMNYALDYSMEFYGADTYLMRTIDLEWTCENGAYYQVYLSTDKKFTDAEKYLTTSTKLTVSNVIPNVKYYWKVKATDDSGNETISKVQTFTPLARVRTMAIDGVANMRDMGGLKTSDGKTIRYGIIYRSAHFDGITAKGKEQMKRLGLKTDLDLRGSANTVSPVGENVQRINFNAPYYANETDGSGNSVGINGREDYVQAFAGEIKTCADPSNYPIGYHCAFGRDRTGTLAAMLYAICGVSRNDIIRDYELSWFCKEAANNEYIKTTAITRLCDFIEGQDGETFKDKASNYLLSIGVTQAELDSVRSILTGETAIPGYDAAAKTARAPKRAAAGETATVYDISEVVPQLNAGDEYEMAIKVKNEGDVALKYGDTVKFAYKERTEKNQDGHYSRTAFGIGSYGFYFYHTAGDIQVKLCDLQSAASNWGRGADVGTIPDLTFKSYGEMTLKAEIKDGDDSKVILTMTYPGGTITHEFTKNDSSDMLFRFGDHDIDQNYVKSLLPKAEEEPAVVYDISEVVPQLNAGDEYEIPALQKLTGDKAIRYGDTVKFAYKERTEPNADGQYSRTAFGIGSYGFYFYHNAGTLGVRTCNMQIEDKGWGRGGSNIATIPEDTFKTYGEITLKAEIKGGDDSKVVLTMTHPGGTITYEFGKDASSDMLFRFGDHDIPENYVKSLLPKTEEPAVVYDISEVVSKVGYRREYKMAVKEKVVGEKALNYGEIVKFAYKERTEKNDENHYSRTAFGIGSYGFYFYHSGSVFGIRTCNMEIEDKNWGRGGANIATIPEDTFKTYGEITLKAEIKDGDGSKVVLTMTYPGGTLTYEFGKNASSDMLFRFGEHDITDNYVKSIAPKNDLEAPVIDVKVPVFKTTAGTYPAENAFTVTDNSGFVDYSVEWSEGALDGRGRLTVGTHTLTIKAFDLCENETTATITYIVTEEPETPVYKITFKSVASEDVVVEYVDGEEKSALTPAVPQREHYDGVWEEFILENNQTQVVNAVYTAKTYTVTFKADGEVVGTQTYTIENTEITVPQVPEKANYTGAWESYVLDGGDKEVNAVYTAKNYTVTFKADGEVVGTQTYTIENTEITVPQVPEKANYTGVWEEFVLENNQTQVVNAVYTAKTYTVTFKADGEVVGAQTYTIENTEITVPQVPEKSHYTGTWESYVLDGGDKVVNAVYTAETYTVTFKADGEIVGTQTYTIENTEITVPQVPEKANYTGVWEEFVLENNQTQVVNAVYTAKTYTVTFKADGEVVGTQTYTIENTQITVPQVPEKANYTGTWENYVLDGGDKVVNAVYKKTGGTSNCNLSVGGAMFVVLGAVAVVLKKKRK